MYVGGQTDEQARAQFSMWSLFPTNLLISQNVLAWSDYALETYSNAELIAINQDPLGSPATRVVGGDLPFPCHDGGVADVVAKACDANDNGQLWDFNAATSTFVSRAFQPSVLENVGCSANDGSRVGVGRSGQPGCAGSQTWTRRTDGAIINGHSSTCLDVYNWAGPAVDVWTCNGGSNQNFTLTAEGLLRTGDGGAGRSSVCLAAVPPQPCSNVWGRTLAKGDIALGFVNNADTPANVTCDAACFATVLKGSTPTSLRARDLWQHADIGTITPPFTFTATVNANGAAAVYRFTPV